MFCGDASPAYLHGIDNYDVIQLPHHGQLDDAQAIFEMLRDVYAKKYFISDNTGSSATSGGSEKVTKHMNNERLTSAMNTKTGTVCYPKAGTANTANKPQGVRLGEMDCRC